MQSVKRIVRQEHIIAGRLDVIQMKSKAKAIVIILVIFTT